MHLRLILIIMTGSALGALAACSGPRNKTTLNATATNSANSTGTFIPAATVSQPGTKACLGIVDGTDIQFTDSPAVVHIVTFRSDQTSPGMCSGTFISPRALLTAGHCIFSSNTVARLITSDSKLPMQGDTGVSDYLTSLTYGAVATKIIDIGFTKDTLSTADETNDLAVILFDSDVAPAVMPIATKRPAVNSALTMVGFGRNSLSDEAQAFTSIKRAGITRLVAGTNTPTVLSLGYTTRAVSDAAAGKASLASEGDSGGAVIYGSQLVGTLVSAGLVPGGTAGTQVLYYDEAIDLTSPQALKLFGLANQAGAGIPTLGKDPKAIDQVQGAPSQALPSAACTQ